MKHLDGSIQKLFDPWRTSRHLFTVREDNSIVEKSPVGQMKFSKPVYDAQAKVYRSEVSEGLCFTAEFDVEENEWSPPLNAFLTAYRPELVEATLAATRGWFTKPLTQDWLTSRLQVLLPDEELRAQQFEGSAEWQIQKLLISKELFTFVCKLIGTVKKERIQLEFEEEVSQEAEDDLEGMEEVDVESNLPADGQPISLGPTRRMLAKEAVLEARHKAARALFRANELTRQYSSLYGEDTDWEDDSVASDSDSDSESARENIA